MYTSIAAAASATEQIREAIKTFIKDAPETPFYRSVRVKPFKPIKNEKEEFFCTFRREVVHDVFYINSFGLFVLNPHIINSGEQISELVDVPLSLVSLR